MPVTFNPPQHVSPLDRYAPAPPPLPVPDHPVVAAVMSGKRYVVFPYVFSMLVMTFRRNLGAPRLVGAGDWPVGPLFGAAVITLLTGWWGFPWGVIWTPLALVSIWRGGRDFTNEVLIDVVGAPEAKRILKLAPKAKPPAAIWLVRLLILVPVLIVVPIFLAVIASSPG